MSYKKIINISIISILLLSLFGCQVKETVNNIPSNEKVNSVFKKANTVFKMLWEGGLQVDKNDEYIDKDNNIYYAINFENINSLNSLNNYLLSIFSPQIVDELMSISFYIPRFIENNNKLYQASYDCSIKVLDHCIVEKNTVIEKKSDVKFVCTTDKILYEDGKNERDGNVYKFNYVYEKIDDKWLFTEFPIIRPFTEQEWDYSKFNNEYHIVKEIKDLATIQKKWEEARDLMYSFNHDPFETGIFSYPIAIGDTILYSRVYNNQFKTVTDVDNYLSTLFSKEIVKGYISGDFISIDGLLYRYYSEGGKGGWAVDTKDTHIEKINENKYVYTWIFFDIDEEKEVYSVGYTYEYVNGRWIFTDFPHYTLVINQ
jgi:hypothetical protein